MAVIIMSARPDRDAPRTHCLEFHCDEPTAIRGSTRSGNGSKPNCTARWCGSSPPRRMRASGAISASGAPTAPRASSWMRRRSGRTPRPICASARCSSAAACTCRASRRSTGRADSCCSRTWARRTTWRGSATAAAPTCSVRDALEALLRIQIRGRSAAAGARALRPRALEREMALMPEWFCARHLALEPSAEGRALLASAFDFLCAEALAQPAVFVHRDYHSRNLMVTAAAQSRHHRFPGCACAVRSATTWCRCSRTATSTGRARGWNAGCDQFRRGCWPKATVRRRDARSSCAGSI